jgi:glyoxylase-like metal-dependent hydrolase (beta-lactamase superfamily II)
VPFGTGLPSFQRSLRRLIAFPADTLVIPGHGPTTTLAIEKRDNPYLGE